MQQTTALNRTSLLVLLQIILGSLLIYLAGFKQFSFCILLINILFIPFYKYRNYFLSALPPLSITFTFNLFNEGLTRTAPLYIAVILSYLISLFIYHQLLQRKVKRPVLITICAIFTLSIALRLSDNIIIKSIFYDLLIIAAYNSLQFIREVDTFKQKLAWRDAIFSFCAFWNGPVFLNLTVAELKSKENSNLSDFLQTHLKAIKSLVIIIPIFAFKNYLTLSLYNNGFYIPGSANISSLFVHQTLIGTIDKMFDVGFPIFGQWVFVFSIFAGGMVLIFNLIFVYTLSITIAQMLGFDVPNPYTHFTNFQTIRGLFSKLYHYYNKNLIDIFYPRFRSYTRKTSIKVGKISLLFVSLLVGGFYWHLLNDIVWHTYELGILELLRKNFLSIPFFVLVALSAIAEGKNQNKDKDLQSRWAIYLKRILLLFYFSVIFFCNRYTKFDGHNWATLVDVLKKAFFLDF